MTERRGHSSGSRGGTEGAMAPPSPVEISHKKDLRQRRPHRFHVSCPPYPATGSDAGGNKRNDPCTTSLPVRKLLAVFHLFHPRHQCKKHGLLRPKRTIHHHISTKGPPLRLPALRIFKESSLAGNYRQNHF